MILQFQPEELQLIVNLLEDRLRFLDVEIARTDRRNARDILEQEEKVVKQIEDKVMAHDLAWSVDELDFMIDFLSHRSQELRHEISRTDNRDYKQALRLRQQTLEKTQDKVTEACCMA
jgi:hypothetical protein